jgi:chromosome segregation ATPase
MEQSAELVRLEEFVDKLLNKYNQLKAECRSLQETLRQRDAECADLKNTVFNLSAERTEVSNKVSGLLDRIEQWENEQLAGKTAVVAGNGAQESLFGDDAGDKSF